MEAWNKNKICFTANSLDGTYYENNNFRNELHYQHTLTSNKVNWNEYLIIKRLLYQTQYR